MKGTVTKYDYPTASSQTYKNYKQDRNRNQDPETQKAKFRQFDRSQRDNERLKVQQEKDKKEEIQRRENKKKLQQQLERKKQQLVQLQKMRNLALDAEKKSHELALIRQEEQKIQKLQNQRKATQNQFNAQNRFLEALRRLEEQKQQNSRKQKQAVYRRKVADETQKIERGNAIKYRKEQEQKQKAMPVEEKTRFQQYKQSLGRTAYNKTVDYTKTCLHNPNIIVPAASVIGNAKQNAQNFNNRQIERSKQKRAREVEDRKISEERGRIAMQKLALQKQYQQYLKEQQEKAKLYNIERLQAGKKNQYIGLKPGTLVQMEANKKIRGEKQFEKVFFNGQNPEWFDKPANKYTIIQSKMGETKVSAQPTTHRPNVRSLGSINPAVSDSHYSFQSQPFQQLTSVKKVPIEENQKQQQKKRVIPLPKQLKQQHNERQREELRYSESEDEQA